MIVEGMMLMIKLGISHQVIGKTGSALKCQSGSKVAKINVHFPTDLSQLWDTVRCLIMGVCFK